MNRILNKYSRIITEGISQPSLNELAKTVKAGVQNAGLIGLIFNTIGVSKTMVWKPGILYCR